jgi:hypothetical protein
MSRISNTHGSRASARLSTNGAIIHDLEIVGGPVDIGDAVAVDYTTPKPTIVSHSRSWLTMDDLLRALAKLEEPIVNIPLDEWNKFIVTEITDLALTKWFGVGEIGLQEAYYYCWDLYDNVNDLWPDLIVRWPSGVVRGLYDNHMDEWYDGGVLASWVGESRESSVLNNTWATQVNGNRFENLSFRAVSTYTWTTGYNFYFWYIAASTDVRADQSYGQNTCVFKNCTFFSESAPEDPYPYALTPTEKNDSIPCANIWFYGSTPTDDVYLYFYDCSFHARFPPGATRLPSAFHLDYDDDETAGVDTEIYHVYLYNCTIDCGPEPFNERAWNDWDTWRSGGLNIYAYNCKFINFDGSPLDPASIPLLTILDDGDRSPVEHTHTSGSSGGYDENATHYNEANEW